MLTQHLELQRRRSRKVLSRHRCSHRELRTSLCAGHELEAQQQPHPGCRRARHRFVTAFGSRRYGKWTFDAEFSLDARGLSAEPAREFVLSATWYPRACDNMKMRTWSPEAQLRITAELASVSNSGSAASK